MLILNWFSKIATPKANIQELTENIEFFMDNLHNSTDSLIFQMCYDDFKNENSEGIKGRILHLFQIAQQRQLQIVLSGPIPHCTMTGVAFSRMVAINEWLMTQYFPDGCFFANNFDTFWNKPHLFEKNGFTLNNDGAISLLKNISLVDR